MIQDGNYRRYRSMNIADMINGLTETQLGELGDALKDLPPSKLARVLVHFASKHRFPGNVEYHILTATRKLIAETQPGMTSGELISAERQMMG